MGAPRRWRAQPFALCMVVGAVLTGCASGGPAPRASDERAAGGKARSGPPMTLNVAQSAPIRAYGPWDFASTAGGVAALAEIHTTGLVSYDRGGKREGRVAARIPSVDDGTVTMLPDGRMRTVWSVRPDARWHDGQPLTADDLVFSFRMTIDPAMVSPIAPIIVQADTVEALDPLTVAITYKTPVFAGLELTNRAFWLFPKHVLGEAFEADKESFLALPFFTTEYINLGPFRLVDFGLGEQQVFEAFDGHFLGRPKTQRIIIHTIADANAMVAGMKAGTLDVLSEKVLSPEQAVLLRDEWAVSGEGRLVSRQDNWAYISPQFDLQWARPVELSKDLRVRAALLHAIDRDAIGEFVQPGFADTSGDTFMRSNDPRATFVGHPFARYRYDRSRAAQLFGDAGWARSADGQLIGDDGHQVQIEVRASNQTWTKETALVADFWRQAGIDASELVIPPARQRDNEYQATFPGVVIRARGSGDGIMVAFDSRLQSLAQNRWQGANYAHYANPRLDTLLDRVASTVDVRENGLVLRDIGEIFATELPALPIYYRTTFAAIRKGVNAVVDDYQGIVDSGDMTRYAHLWEIQ